jgi:hypothetical protein
MIATRRRAGHDRLARRVRAGDGRPAGPRDRDPQGGDPGGDAGGAVNGRPRWLRARQATTAPPAPCGPPDALAGGRGGGKVGGAGAPVLRSQEGPGP